MQGLPPFRERLRIDGAIKTPGTEAHAVTAGGRNIHNYSEPGEGGRGRI